ncbi:MAG: ABC transporter substrate-binding protein [Anaerolineaceae bacterium]
MKSKLFLILTVVTLALTACVASTPATAPTTVLTEAPVGAPTEAPAVPYPVTESTNAPAESFTVVDALGREVSFNKVPERIALVGKGVFMVADAVYTFPETSTNIIAIAAMNQKSEAFIKMVDMDYASKQSIDRTAGPEQIAALQPDCVIMKTTNPDLGVGLDTLQIPYIYVDFETPEQYTRDLQTLGQLFQNPERAEVLSNFFMENEESVKTALTGLTEEEKPDTLLLYYNESDGAIAFNVAPVSWMQTTIVELAGGNPVWKDTPLDKGWTKVSLEQVAAWNPEVIVVTAYTLSIPEVVEKLKADPQWQELEAVKNGKLYGMAADIYSYDQPDTRWALGLEWLAAILHPDRFPNYDLTQSAQKFYQQLYNLDEASFQQNIAPLLTGATN